MPSFLFPLSFHYTFPTASGARPPSSHIWEYSLYQPSPSTSSKGKERLIVIGVDVLKRSIASKTFFRAWTPDDILLGDLFFQFVNDYNDLQRETPIQCVDEQGMPVVWWFRLHRKWYQFNKDLDPSLTVKENRIKDNAIIICDRLSF